MLVAVDFIQGVLLAAKIHLSAQISDSSLTSFLCLSDAIKELEDVSIVVHDISGEKKDELDESSMESAIVDRVSQTLVAHTAYAEKCTARKKENHLNAPKGLRPNHPHYSSRCNID